MKVKFKSLPSERASQFACSGSYPSSFNKWMVGRKTAQSLRLEAGIHVVGA